MVSIAQLYNKKPDEVVTEPDEGADPLEGFGIDAFFAARAAANGETPEETIPDKPLLTRAGEMGNTEDELDPEAEGIVGEPVAEPSPTTTVTSQAEPSTSARGARLLALEQAIEDPAVAARVFQALSPAEEAAAVAPTLPEDIYPDSPEARLWYENQELRRKVDAIGATVHQQTALNEQERAQQAALVAVQSFKSQYAGVLNEEDFAAITRTAGESGLPGVLAQTTRFNGNLQGAFTEALEMTLWSNPQFREKATGVAEPPLPGPTAESENRKRKLNALSAAASPVAPPRPQAQALETRSDGRLTPESRQRLVQDMAGQLARAKNSNY